MKRMESDLSCPICQTEIRIDEMKLICKENHTFDIARQGYVNVLNRAVKTNYAKELFVSRHKLTTQTSFFTPLQNKLNDVIKGNLRNSNSTILDAGCGEGSHLNKIKELLGTECEKVKTVGIDIAKEGILEAAKHYEGHVWCVADLANLPFAEETFNVILNILSPANYEEFIRVLKSDGAIVKVVPQKAYLNEIREFNDGHFDHDSLYSNEQTVDLFHTHFDQVENIPLQYDVTLGEDSLEYLLQMTPLTWNWSEKKVTDFIESGTRTITVDYEILIGRKK